MPFAKGLGQPGASDIERFLTFVKRDGRDDCWLWQGYCDQEGYGTFRFGRKVRAHRFAYRAFIGPIPDRMDLDHVCGNRDCINPSHLEPVTPYQNSARGRSWAWEREKTHCRRGHPYAGENLYITPQGRRHCRACGRINALKYYHARKQSGLEVQNAAD